MGRGVLRWSAWRSRSTLVVGALALGTLALAGLMAYEAYDASRSHRATAERALRDYATFAAWELLANATDNLHTALDAALTPATGVKATSPYERLPSPTMLAPLAASTLSCADSAADAARYYFRLDFRDGSPRTSGAALAPGERAWVTDTISAHARGVYQPDW